jgi:hypothetical protein
MKYNISFKKILNLEMFRDFLMAVLFILHLLCRSVGCDLNVKWSTLQNIFVYFRSKLGRD